MKKPSEDKNTNKPLISQFNYLSISFPVTTKHNGQQAIKMSEKGDNMLKFNNVQKTIPFVI